MADYGITTQGISWNAPTETMLKASNLSTNDYFGWSVAISGNYAIVGANNEDSSGTNQDGAATSGAAYIFELSGGSWTQKQMLKASNISTGDNFGNSVAISGNYAIVGANKEDSSGTNQGGAVNSGAAYIFERNGSGTWGIDTSYNYSTENVMLKASNISGDDNFGNSVAISGNYAIVGAIYEDSSGTTIIASSYIGAAYIFELSGGTWGIDTSYNYSTANQKLKASNISNYDEFGFSVAISGNYAIVGAYEEDSSGTNQGGASVAGAAYIFERNGSGIWGIDTSYNYSTENVMLKASNISVNDRFGYSVAISGNYAIVGAYQEDSSGIDQDVAGNSGAAYIFERDSSGAWGIDTSYNYSTETQMLKASNPSVSDYFGWSVAISGNYAIVAAYREDSSGIDQTGAIDSGAAYIFELSGGVWGNYNSSYNYSTENKMLKASNAVNSDYFGYSVAISGNYAIVGAYLEDSSGTDQTGAIGSGAAYIYQGTTSITSIQPTELTFATNTLTIQNSIDAADTDKVSFVLPADKNMPSLDVTALTGSGIISYTLKIGETLVVDGSFNATGFDLLKSVPLIATTDTTYTLTLTADAALNYTIVGTSATTNLATTDYSEEQLLAAGYTFSQLIAGGVWAVDQSMNFLKSIYTNGFIDVSGGTLRTRGPNGHLYIGGNADITGQTYLGGKLSVGTNDLSYNGNPFIHSDLSNGNFVADVSLNSFLTVPSNIIIVDGPTNNYGAYTTYSNNDGTTTFHVGKSASNVFNIVDQNNAGVYMASGSTSFTSTSDVRLKTSIVPLTSAIEKIMALKPCTYKWKTEEGKEVRPHPGFIAQETEEALPEVVHIIEHPEGHDYKGVNTTDMIPYLVKTIQEQEMQIKENQMQIKENQMQIKELHEIIRINSIQYTD